MRLSLRAFAATAATALIAFAVAEGTASASTSGTQPNFAAQARGYGLSSTQAGELQQEVNAYITKHGGTQAAINEVKFTGGAIVFVVPGQKYARPVTSVATAVPATGETCPYLDFCPFENTNYEGTEYYLTQCNVYTYIPWTTTGSWKNDQSPGTSAYIYNLNGSLRLKTPGAWSGDTSYNWAPVGSVEACKS